MRVIADVTSRDNKVYNITISTTKGSVEPLKAMLSDLISKNTNPMFTIPLNIAVYQLNRLPQIEEIKIPIGNWNITLKIDESLEAGGMLGPIKIIVNNTGTQDNQV